ncbi:MAG: ATP-binding protein [Desulfoprunum sp.]|nr:ATP-binding protein [Desulfoprunum sp.]
MRRFYLNLFSFLLISILLTSIGSNWIMGIYFKNAHKEQIRIYNHEVSRGCFYLLGKELKGLGESDIPAKIKELQVHFGYPIDVKKSSDLDFTPDETALFSQNKVIIRIDGTLYLQRLPDSEYAMLMGPFTDYEVGTIDHIVGFATVGAFMTIFSLAWAYYFWRQLSMIGNAAKAFGDGDLSARVKTCFLSPTLAIATIFNGMADQIEQLISSHKELINAVSHELRTPICRIRFGLEQVYSSDETERTRHIAGIRKDINELEDLVTELLGYAKLESSQSQTLLPKGTLLPWLQELVVLAKETLRVPITFVHAGLDASRLISYDPRLLERALHNLLQNANRFAKTGINLTLSASATEVKLTVEDDGPGISEKDRERIFEPFVRLDSSRNREFGGYGLGLAIVRQIARCHHGRIIARPSFSGGAAFEMTWPLIDGNSLIK